MTTPRHRKLRILAQDPGVCSAEGTPLFAELEIPWERLEAGPKGHRFHVIDFDASTNTLYAPWGGNPETGLCSVRRKLTKHLEDPHFHAQNVYAIAMSTLALFERALGRHVDWAFESGGHQLKIAPHAFAEANAFYSRRDEGLLFGYFPVRKEGTEVPVFTCLSHDIVCHETAHALLDALREDFMRPSSSDQAAFHEGFSDIVALLSVLRQKELVEVVLRNWMEGSKSKNGREISSDDLRPENLKKSPLLGLADTMGQHMGSATVRSDALRRSIELEGKKLSDEEFKAPHRRGEILVAAMMQAYLAVWIERLGPLGFSDKRPVQLERVVEEANDAARQLATIAIRAIDYTPPIDLDFRDYLCAILTADRELVPDDTKYHYREKLRASFRKFGIEPAEKADEHGYWQPPEHVASEKKRASKFGSQAGQGGSKKPPKLEISYERNHLAQLQSDPDEVFKFLWENRKALELDLDAFTRVRSVRPVIRCGPDGFVQHETVAVYLQTQVVRASDLKGIGIEPPEDMPSDLEIHLYGGGTLIFGEFGQLKFHIGSGVRSRSQTGRLDNLWAGGEFDPEWSKERRFTRLHRLQAFSYAKNQSEYW